MIGGSADRRIGRSLFERIASALAVVAIATVPAGRAGAAAPGSVTVTNVAELAREIQSSRAATVSAYVLSTRSSVARAMMNAAHAGAEEVLVLDASPYGAFAQDANAQTAAVMGRAGVKVLLSRGDLHLKSAFVGRRVYLSDRNFDDHGGFVVASDDPADLSAVRGALQGQAARSAHLCVIKRDALELEASVITDGSGPLDVETESFGWGNVVYNALRQRARRDRVRLVVAAREYDGQPGERRAVDELRQEGIEVRIGDTNEKMAVDNDGAWAGSANATRGVPDQADWGYASGDRDFMQTLRGRFERDFNAASSGR